MSLPLIGTVLEAGLKILDKVIPDPAAKAAAQQKLMELQQAGEFKAVELQLSAIIEEAKSNDPWTSRARPSFLYVMYVIMLAGIPMGVVAAFRPEIATAIAAGFGAWLNAIPEEMYWLFGAGYLGYTGARGMEKMKLGKKG
jgi:hypothetical protein